MPIPTDPLLANQWHLNQTVFGLLDLNVLGVWNPAEGPFYTGAGTRTVVIDDGFDYNHQDFDNYDQSLDWDFALNTNDPFGTAANAHGTAVAGIIGAAADGTGAVGVAFDTSLVGYRVAELISDAWLQDIRDAITSAAIDGQTDVANISQGIADDLGSEFGVGYLALRFDEIEASIATAVTFGRGGLGMTIVKAAGDSRAGEYDVNADDWTNDTRQVVVGAVDQNGFVSSSSSYGAAVLVSGFGTPSEVVTTDRTGAAGYEATDFITGFSGTSAAAPMVSGVVALMYEANAGLGWRDVQSILAVSARQVGSEVGAGITGSERYAWEWNAATTWNGGGQHFSNDYGYGLVDALAAVRLAETWLLTGTVVAVSGNQFSNTVDVLNVSTIIPDGNATGLSFSGNASFDDAVERVTVEMTFSTTFTGDMEVYLTSPSGTVSRMIDNAGGGNAGGGNDFNGTWTFESQAFRGERAPGLWTVRVVDSFGDDVLTVSDIVIRTFGAASSNERYIFTNEYSDYAGISGHATAVNDSNFGIDTVNAAAVSSASVIRLDGFIGFIDGVGVTFANIEHAIGGDGGDTLIGNIGSNQLFGQRGADSLYGGDDTDFLYGGTNNDLLNGDGGIDTLFGGDGDDVLDGGSLEDNSFGGAGNDRFRFVAGEAGDNVFGGADSDTLDLSSWINIFYSWNVNLQTGVVELVPNDFGAAGSYSIDTVEHVTGSNLNDSLTGDALANSLSGGLGSDTLFGGDGDDVLNGGASKDDSFGGAGNDRFVISGIDLGDNIFGGADSDTLDLSGWTVANVGWNVNLQTGVVQELPNGAGANGIHTIDTVEHVTGSAFNDSLTGDGLANSLSGGLGSDTINGGSGIDTLFGGDGDDVLNGGAFEDHSFGGAGNDRFVFSGNTFGDNVFGGADTDTLDLSGYNVGGLGWNVNLQTGVVVAVPNILGAEGTHVIDTVEHVTGSDFNDSLTGDGLANSLSGGGGDDVLIGEGGDDTLFGGDGNDTLRGESGIDTLFGGAGDDVLDGGTFEDNSFGGAGNDRFRIISFGLGDNIFGGADSDTLDLSSWARPDMGWNVNLQTGVVELVPNDFGAPGIYSIDTVEHVTGSDFNDSLTGDGLVNSLSGGGGDDVLTGGTGADVLVGGIGIDTATYGGTAGVVVRLSNGTGINGDAAGDSLSGIENVTSGLGNDTLIGSLIVANLLNGGGGNDFLDGLSGNDTLIGGAGNDIYVVDSLADVIAEAFAEGTGDLLLASASYVLAAAVAVETMQTTSFAGVGAINLTGNALAQQITGNAGANVLTDGAGAADILKGSLGNDSYVIRTGSTLLIEGVGEGTADRVLAATSFVLASDDNIEVMQTTSFGGLGAINLTGNALAQTITGNAGANVLTDGAGAADILKGSLGNDSYIIRTGGTLLIEGAGEGTADRVLAGVSFVLAADDHIEVMQTTSAGGTGAINLTGNALAQSLFGNAGANVLDGGPVSGGGAADTLGGGAGNDTYVVRSSGTLIVEGLGQGTADRVSAAVSFGLASDDHIEILQTTSFGGVGAINLTGNGLAQSLFGNAGVNALRGAAGNDTLTGGGGADDFIFNTALGPTNIDGITDFVAGLDDMLLRATVFAGIGVGALAGFRFHAGLSGQAQTADTRITYETDNGNLWYDADGNGAGLRVQFGDLAAGLAVTAGDFAVF